MAAMSAAIEIYNKPVIAHREETFAILSCTAWELLLKARLISANGNKLETIFERERIPRKDGRPSTRTRVRRSASGNPTAIGLRDAIGKAQALPDRPLDPLCAENLNLLSEVRNNAVHFANDNIQLCCAVHGLAVAAVRNYVRALSDWFDEDLSGYRFSILPLSFEADAGGLVLPGARRSRTVEALQRHIESTAARAPAGEGRYAIALRIETRMVGARQRDAIPIRQGRGADAAQVAMNEELLLERYPLRYADLCARIKERVPAVKFDQRFHAIKRALRQNSAHAHERRLQLGNPKSPKTIYYSVGMVDAMVARLENPNLGQQ